MPLSAPSTMRALIRSGDPRQLHLDISHPKPSSETSPSYYIIKTHACALTREELTWPEPLGHETPIPGYDVAGTVLSVPSDSSPEGKDFKFNPGDEVYGMTTFGGRGNARDFTEAHESEIALKPKNSSWEEAAAIPLSALSAWQALFVHGNLDADFTDGKHGDRKRVLVTAASGGVGVWGVQLAHQAGFELVGTCGPANVEFVKRLGAATVLDYTKANLLEWVNNDREAREFDVILDCIGGQTLQDAWKCARKGGRVISVAVPPDSKKPEQGVAEGVKGIWFIVSENGAQLEQITTLVEDGKCNGFVDGVFCLEQWEDAFERLEGGHAKGKVVLRLG